MLAGYYDGKHEAERVLRAEYGDDGAALRPGMIHGPRRVPSLGLTLPLQLIGSPLEAVLASNALQVNGYLPPVLRAL